RPDAGSDQAFLVEEGLAPAHHLDAGEQASLGERVVLDEALGLGAVLGVDDDDAAVAALAVVVDLRAGGEQLVLVGGEILEMRPAHLVAQLQTVRLVPGDYGIRHPRPPMWRAWASGYPSAPAAQDRSDPSGIGAPAGSASA